jgi:cytochrome c
VKVLLALGALLAGAAPPPPGPPEIVSGERLFRRCVACHGLAPAENSPAGPTLHAIVCRPVAGETGFEYSPALRALAAQHPDWTPELLDAFLADPEGFAPGTYMGFFGMNDPDERRALIEWLATVPEQAE